MNPPNQPVSLRWHFPLSRPHTGVPLGNGAQGLLVWGETSLLLTVAISDAAVWWKEAAFYQKNSPLCTPAIQAIPPQLRPRHSGPAPRGAAFSVIK